MVSCIACMDVSQKQSNMLCMYKKSGTSTSTAFKVSVQPHGFTLILGPSLNALADVLMANLTLLLIL